jgi:FAD/FMN-containing dehydrogenase
VEHDVVNSVAFARAHALEIAVRGGGHDLLGASAVEDGLVIDLSMMKQIEIDAGDARATVQPGALSSELKSAAVPANLATVLGCNPSVGVAGLTLGGGIGWFLGTHGAACDNLISARVVTASGEIIAVNDKSHADLFWAIRGGGGNFGVASKLEMRLHPLERVIGGVVAFEQSDVRAFLRFYRDYMNAAPDPLAVELTIYLGRPTTIWAMACWSGSEEQGMKALEPLRRFSVPVADTIEALPWSRFLYRMPPRPPGGGPNTYWRGTTLDAVTDSAIDRIAGLLEAAPPGAQLGMGHFMHGEICRAAPASSPLRRRAGSCTQFISVSWSDPRQADRSMQWVDQSWESVQREPSHGTYVNYLSDGSEGAVRATYGANYDRLARVKRLYDPANVFRRNRNIRPAG